MHLPALVAYLQGLRDNNNKAWFVMNKPAYDILRDEFQQLVAEVVAGLVKHDPLLYGIEPRKALFRIYRDIRFAKDKTPYKTYFSASLAEAGARKSGPMYYLSIDADGRLHQGAGCWLPERDLLARLRHHVVDDHEGLARVAKARRFAATFGSLSQEDKLARLPKGFDADLPGIERFGESLRLKSFAVGVDRDLTKTMQAGNEALAKSIVTTFAAAVPLVDWLRRGRARPG